MKSITELSRKMAGFGSLFTIVCHAMAASLPGDVDALAERTRREFNIPGISVAIVKAGQAVVVKGYGVRQAGESAPVDSETLFNIGSNTKAFTVAALAALVEEGRLDWDDPVTRHLPGFQMYDAWVTREMTVRDLLSHRSSLGLGAGDLLWWPETGFSREEIVARQRFIKPATSFRSRFAYENCLYIVAGQLVQAIAGKTWEDVVRERLLAPLGMKHSSLGREALTGVGNKALPHVQAGQQLKTVAFGNHSNFAPAGGINSCAADMARWVTALLEAAKAGPGPGFGDRCARQP
ncbi:MAG: serine hydrolase [Verrucomicrobia bacterium]|nr:serine hydrolase [Verrucomicrobiota bacterium]